MLDTITNLQCWLEADSIVGLSHGDAVATWEDKHTTNVDFSQGSSSLRPTYRNPLTDFRNFPGVEGDGSNDEMTGGTALSFAGKTGITVFAVVHPSATLTGTDTVISRDEANNRGWSLGIEQGIPLFVISSSATTRTRRNGSKIDVRGLPCVITARYKGTATAHMKLWVNGASDDGTIDAAVPSSIGNNGPTLRLFNNGFNDYLTGKIIAVGVYDRDLTDSERIAVERYFMAKYGLGALEETAISSNIGCHQGVTTDGTKYYTIDTLKVQRRDNAWALEDENTSPVTGIADVNHLGDGDYYNNNLYIPITRWVSCADNSDPYIGLYDTTTLARVSETVITPPPDGGASGVAVIPELNLLLVSSFCDGTKLWKFNLTTLAPLGTITLKQTISDIQGLTWNDRLKILYITSNTGQLWSVDLVGNVKMIYNDSRSPDSSVAHEGLKYYDDEILWLIDQNTASSTLNKQVHTLTPLFNGAAQNTFLLSQSVSYELVTTHNKDVTSSLNLTQMARYTFGQKVVLQSLALSQSLLSNLIRERSLSDTLTFVQAATADVRKTASNTITFSQTVDTELTKGAVNSFVINQSLSLSWIHTENLIQTFALSQVVVVNQNITRSTANTLSLSQSVQATRVRFATAQNTFVILQNAVATVIGVATNTLTLSQSVTVERVINQSVSNNLLLSQSITRNVSYVLNVGNTLQFLHSHIRPLPDGSVTYIPDAYYTIPRDIVILQVANQSITLNKPRFGDKEGGLGKVIAKRTINGNLYTYVRRTNSRKLSYVFDVSRAKSQELRNYILENLSNPMQLTNWKGEVWYGHITNNPFTLSARSRSMPCDEEAFEIEIEFEGVKIHG